MSGDEVFVLIVAGVAGIVGAVITRISSLPRCFTERNPGIGLMRLAVVSVLAWTAYVIQYHGDPSIKGVYVFFYLALAYGITKMFGQMGAEMFGPSLRSDAYERKNFAAALFIASFSLATGIIFGGSVWGEADPLGEGEGGWWIPMGFFLLGWGTLVVATALYLWREPGRFRRQICQERDGAMAWSVAVYMVSTAIITLGAVAGDFWGWTEGILSMGTIALMLVGHELILLIERAMPQKVYLRVLERCVYIALAAIVWLLDRAIDRFYVGG